MVWQGVVRVQLAPMAKGSRCGGDRLLNRRGFLVDLRWGDDDPILLVNRALVLRAVPVRGGREVFVHVTAES